MNFHAHLRKKHTLTFYQNSLLSIMTTEHAVTKGFYFIKKKKKKKKKNPYVLWVMSNPLDFSLARLGQALDTTVPFGFR
jgi:hypothetical protein